MRLINAESSIFPDFIFLKPINAKTEFRSNLSAKAFPCAMVAPLNLFAMQQPSFLLPLHPLRLFAFALEEPGEPGC